ncbi:S1 family peptidase [Actinokineospora cianjurensis]|uniref:Trypsin-like peptidase n=1 Tax=Actinokineospora cianjurensis TaxID=585224 RepID=A0A421BBZ4_9PSEU|nr:serine protease [Actinokineospora cianjurensis]RLK61867.1 trypsin-like peptidase [Actinokineospora cianjurensis]
MPSAERARVAELIVTGHSGRRRGSGYRVSTGAVLTAAHVVLDAVEVTVRFLSDLPGEWTSPATVVWSAGDVAVLRIDPPDTVPPVEFGVIDGRHAAFLPAHAVGFPLWKLRGDFRDSHQASGTVTGLSGWRSETLEFTVPVPPERVSSGSPWEGMSGAAVWVDGAIVGVLARHHASDGPGRLAAVRVEHLHRAPADVQAAVGWSGSPRDVVPPEPARVVRAAYQDEPRSIAPCSCSTARTNWTS